MAKVITRNYAFTLQPETDNTITASGNYRIFTLDDVLLNVISINYIKDDITFPESTPSFADGLKKYVRYSKDGEIWSMWYDYSDINFEDTANVISTLQFDPDDNFYISFKYEYNNGTDFDEIPPITINKIDVQLTIRQVKVPLALNSKLNLSCTPEFCAETLFDRNSKLDLYDIGNLGDIYLSMSFVTQTLAGLPALYFQTSPDLSGTDYIFREHTLYNIIQRKCIKVVVPGNRFPDSSFLYSGTDMTYQGPMEIHLDKAYFESMFGQGKEPRKKDFLYMPIVNRMYEIEDVEMVRGLMMMPVYWKCRLIKYIKNINVLKDGEQEGFLDNILLTSEDQFGTETKEQNANATMQQQYSTVSNVKDEVRSYMDKAVVVKEDAVDYNYTRLINYYYNMKCIGYEDENCIIYNNQCLFSKGNDSTFTFSLKIPNITETQMAIIGSNSEDDNFGIGINLGKYNNNKYIKASLYIKINGLELTLDLNEMISQNEWYSFIVGVSPTYKQVELYAYSFVKDEYDENVTSFKKLNSLLKPIPEEEITMEGKGNVSLKAGDYYLANLRIFNRNMPIEKHEFILSQLFIKDESVLHVIDNCRPKLGMPYLMKKY